jgi:ribose transport system substrate-binding protein
LSFQPLIQLKEEQIMKTKVRFAALFIVVALVLSACAPIPAPVPAAQPTSAPAAQPTAAAPVAAGKRPQVCLVMKSLANEFFKVMADATDKWAKSDNTFDLTMVGMNSETDIDTQINAVENCITKKVDLIVLAPADSVGLVPSVKKALAAGITVVNFDVMLDQKALGEAGLKDFLFVGPDNAEGAKLAGDALAKKLGPGG